MRAGRNSGETRWRNYRRLRCRRSHSVRGEKNNTVSGHKENNQTQLVASGVIQHPLYENLSDSQATHVHGTREGGTVVSWLHLGAVVQLSSGFNAVHQEEDVAGTAANHWVSNCYRFPGLGPKAGASILRRPLIRKLWWLKTRGPC